MSLRTPRRFWAVPNPSQRVIFPAGSPKEFQVIPQHGCWVPEGSFWDARLRDGDVMRADPPADALSAPVEAAPAPALASKKASAPGAGKEP